MIKKCEQCGKSFNSKRSYYKFCSRECGNKSRRNGKMLVCKICKKTFWATQTRIKLNAQYCSTECGCKIAKQNGSYINCIVCGKSTYSRKRDLSTKKFCSKKCRNIFIRGKNHHNYINGRLINSNGYTLQLTNNGYVLEHRTIMEKIIGRKLTNKEVVHHINGDITDNRIDNLVLFPTNKSHLQYHKFLRTLIKN